MADASMERECRECGITHIEPGSEVDGELLCWQDNDLCSRCGDRLQKQIERDAARYRHLRNRPTRTVDVALGGVFAWRLPENLMLGGEDLDRAVDADLGAGVSEGETLERRLATCLAECIDTPLFTGQDEFEIRLSFFKPDISEKAATLLEEAGL